MGKSFSNMRLRCVINSISETGAIGFTPRDNAGGALGVVKVMEARK